MKVCKSCKGLINEREDVYYRTTAGIRRLSFCGLVHAEVYFTKVAKRKSANEYFQKGYIEQSLKSIEKIIPLSRDKNGG